MKNTSIHILIGLTCVSLLASCVGAPPGGNGRPPFSPSESSGSLIETHDVSSQTNNTGNENTSPSETPSSTTSTANTSSSVSTDTVVQTQNTTATSAQTYTKTVAYSTPSRQGQTNTSFTVTVDNGVITSASAQYVSGDHEDQRYQSHFSQSIASAVVGKKASDVSLDVVGGASLTTAAFQEFIQSI